MRMNTIKRNAYPFFLAKRKNNFNVLYEKRAVLS